MPRGELVLEGLLVPGPSSLDPRCTMSLLLGGGTCTFPAQPSLPLKEPSSWTGATVLQGGPALFPAGPVTQPRPSQNPKETVAVPTRAGQGGSQKVPVGQLTRMGFRDPSRQPASAQPCSHFAPHTTSLRHVEGPGWPAVAEPVGGRPRPSYKARLLPPRWCWAQPLPLAQCLWRQCQGEDSGERGLHNHSRGALRVRGARHGCPRLRPPCRGGRVRGHVPAGADVQCPGHPGEAAGFKAGGARGRSGQPRAPLPRLLGPPPRAQRAAHTAPRNPAPGLAAPSTHARRWVRFTFRSSGQTHRLLTHQFHPHLPAWRRRGAPSGPASARSPGPTLLTLLHSPNPARPWPLPSSRRLPSTPPPPHPQSPPPTLKAGPPRTPHRGQFPS